MTCGLICWCPHFLKVTCPICSDFWEIYVFLVFYIIFSISVSGKWNVAVILSEKWVVKNKVLLLHYCYWRNGQGHFLIILDFEWFFSKSPHCLCLKINFKLCLSRLLQSGSAHQYSIVGKKINIVSGHFDDVNTFLACFFPYLGNS